MLDVPAHRISCGTGTAAPRSNRMRSISKLFLWAASIRGVISGANIAVFMSTFCQLCGKKKYIHFNIYNNSMLKKYCLQYPVSNLISDVRCTQHFIKNITFNEVK